MVEKNVGGTVTLLMYDEAGHLLGEYSNSGTLIQETIWFEDIPVATLRPNGASVSIYYVHADQLNAPRMITRSTDNAIMWRWDTDPFGTAIPNQNPQSLGVFVYNLRLPGQYYNAETGLDYNYHRDYDPRTGRYLESDPIGLHGGVNTYAYGSGNPISNIDTTGLAINWNILYSNESYKATAIALCRDIDQSDPGGPWATANSARDTDPGDLNQRDAEHYLYAQDLRSDAGGGIIGGLYATGGVLVHQSWKLVRAIPFTPWLTTPPSWQNFAWGITGAWNSQKPNCGCSQ
jgi:RHS repeat-associated protein